MKSKNALCDISIAIALQLGMLAGSAQTNIYLFSGSKTNITLPPGTYIITAYGAPGGYVDYGGYGYGGLGAEMSGEFTFSTPTTLTLLVGEGAGASFYHPYSGGGGGSIINSSAIANLTEISGIASPDDYYGNGEIIITALPPPLAITADGANVVLTWPAADTGLTTTGYTLECATNLVPPVAWQTNATPPPSSSAGRTS